MSTYITLSHIQIQNANCVSGLTFGFPAITHFLGYVHALSRQLEQSEKLTLGGCAIVCHQHQIHAYQPKGWGEYIFALTRNPLTKGGKTAPIIEEGKMHLTVSLVIECKGLIKGGEAGKQILIAWLKKQAIRQKLAGGVIHHIQNILIESARTDEEQQKLTRKIRRRLLPGFVLLDRAAYLEKQLAENPKVEMLDAWLDFVHFKCKAKAKPKKEEEITEKTEADWKYQAKPEAGYLVPITTGYKAISDIYKNGEVKATRDKDTPFCFVESVYSIGEWQSPHRLKNINDALWHYDYKDGWYLCANQTTIDNHIDNDDDSFDFLN